MVNKQDILIVGYVVKLPDGSVKTIMLDQPKEKEVVVRGAYKKRKKRKITVINKWTEEEKAKVKEVLTQELASNNGKIRKETWMELARDLRRSVDAIKYHYYILIKNPKKENETL